METILKFIYIARSFQLPAQRLLQMRFFYHYFPCDHIITLLNNSDVQLRYVFQDTGEVLDTAFIEI